MTVRPGEPDPDAKQPNLKMPPGYENDQLSFLDEMRQLYADNDSFDFTNHEAGVQDLQFMVGDQWDGDIRQKRITGRKPVLTVNRIPAFVAQLIGNRRMNETDIKILPDNGGTVAVAKVREGLIRSIQKISKAFNAYDNAFAGAVTCGIGNFQLELDYETDEVWEVSMRIRSILDHFAVVWDRSMTDPTGADAGNAFLVQTMPLRDFYTRWPWATPSDVITTRFPAELQTTGWFTREDVRVVDYWRMRSHRRTIALMNNGATEDITDAPNDKLAQIAQRPDGSPFIRDVERRFAQKYVCSGADVLEGPFNLPIDRIPIFRVPGWEIRVGDTMHRWGLIRFLKDPQRLHNYWRSAIAEKIMRSPRVTWTAADTAVTGREAEWRNSNASDDPLLIWNAESGQEPKRVDPIQVEEALMAQAEITTQDLKDVSNIHEANLGAPSNEVSGAAINARVRVSDTGTAIYEDNLEKAIEECGRVADQLIDVVYDTPRIIKVIGADSKELMQTINLEGNPNSIDITVGKYSVTASTGASFDTKRQESAQAMMALATAMPQTLAVSADLIVESQDWPGADKIAARLKKMLPPGILDPDEMTPEIQAASAAQQQQAAVANQAALQKAQSDYLKNQSEATLNFSRAHNFVVQAGMLPAKLQNESLNTASEVSSRELRDSLESIKTATGA